MRRTQFERVRSGLGTGVLVVALFFQMLPFFLILVVMAHALGVSGGGMLAIVPALLFGMVFAACWLASKRPRVRPSKRPSIHQGRVPARPPAKGRRTPDSPRRHTESLIKTRAERYQDLRDALVRAWR